MGEGIMSSNIDPNTLLAQAQALRERMEQLQTAIASAEQTRVNVLRAVETIKALKTDSDLLVPADPDFNALVKARPVDKENVVVRLGGDIYAKVPSEDAVKLLEEKARGIAKQIQLLTEELRQVAQALQTTEMLLQQIAMAMQAQLQAQPQKKEGQGPAKAG